MGNLDTQLSSFKRDVVSVLVHDTLTAKASIHNFPEDYFEDFRELELIFTALRDFYTKYHGNPTRGEHWSVLEDELKRISADDEMVDSVKTVFDSVYDNTTYNPSYVKEKFTDAIITHKMKLVLEGAADRLENGEYDALVQDVFKARNSISEEGQSFEFWSDLNERHKRRQTRNVKVVSCGYDALDDIMNGGLPKKSLGMIMAGSGRGKSAYMGAFALNASMLGKNVAYITLEIDEDAVMERMDSFLSKIPMNLLPHRGKMLGKAVSSAYVQTKQGQGVPPGKLFVKYYPTKSVGVHQVRAYLERLRAEQGVVPDVVFVDYMDLLKLETHIHGAKKYELLEGVCEELRGLAGEFDVAIWTASQVNRGGLSKSNIDMDDIASALGKVFPLDFLGAVVQTKEEKDINVMRFQVVKSRIGPTDQTAYFQVFFDNMQFSCYNEEDADKLGLVVELDEDNNTGSGSKKKKKGKGGPKLTTFAPGAPSGTP